MGIIKQYIHSVVIMFRLSIYDGIIHHKIYFASSNDSLVSFLYLSTPKFEDLSLLVLVKHLKI